MLPPSIGATPVPVWRASFQQAGRVGTSVKWLKPRPTRASSPSLRQRSRLCRSYRCRGMAVDQSAPDLSTSSAWIDPEPAVIGELVRSWIGGGRSSIGHH
jgi:hypothetical protein